MSDAIPAATLTERFRELKAQVDTLGLKPRQWIWTIRLDTYARLLPMRRKKLFGYAQRQRRLKERRAI